MQTTYAFLKLTSAIIDSQQKSDVVSSDTQQFAENFFCRTGITSAAKAASDFKTLTARLEAAPFQNKTEVEFLSKLFSRSGRLRGDAEKTIHRG